MSAVSTRRPVRRARLAVESLEHREVPATLVSPTTLTYQDLDGDSVAVTLSKPLLKAGNVNAVFTFNAGGILGNNITKQQLWAINPIGLGTAATGTTITVTATRSLVTGGNGLANVGHIDATGIDLGAVVVDGDLGQIDAGDATTATRGLTSLTVQSMGRFGTTTQAPGGDLGSSVDGRLGALTVKSDLTDAKISVFGGAVGTIGRVFVGGNVTSGSIFAAGGIGPIVVNGDIVGGASPISGSILTFGNLAGVAVGGSVRGGDGVDSGVLSAFGGIGPVTIKGTLSGGTGSGSGLIQSSGSIASVDIGSLLGGAGANSGRIESPGNIGAILVRGSVVGGTGDHSGAIESGGRLAGLVVNGSLVGGVGLESGRVRTTGDMGPVTIRGNLTGGDGKGSGSIESFTGQLGSLRINGSVLGGVGALSGRVYVTGDLGPVSIQGSVIGGNDLGVPGRANESGMIGTGGNLQSLFIGGSLVGGAANGVNGGYSSGSIYASKHAGPITIGGDIAGSDADGSASITGGNMTGITVGGSLLGTAAGLSAGIFSNGSLGFVRIGGDVRGGLGLLSASIVADSGSIGGVTVGGSITTKGGNHAACIDAREDIGAILVKGSIVGTAAAPIVISAAGANANDGDDLGSIQSLTVYGRVEHARILAGYDPFGPTNADARIGAVVVGGDWIASDLVAAVDAGADKKFGTIDDVLVTDPINNPKVISTIASVTIKGQVLGTPGVGDNFGFCAQRIGSLSIGGDLVPLKSGGSNDFLSLGPTWDVRLNEV
ncbi:MAG TPA: hypothetical protein VKE40_02125 [Gemmataceae bacterium]|nr:hypothetical protein [Gemmataceae bacterium]